ncbi:hypothetical protein DFS33DRAFT_1278709 [Desarmillaria ectypa]|nr:hypothetical protein DFS33DRAFT_1278709 [Desarmillaria ectypa]
MILMNQFLCFLVFKLNTQFYRPPGDCGNPRSYTYPVVISTVEAAARGTIVLVGREGQMTLVDAFVKEGTGESLKHTESLLREFPVRWLLELIVGAPDTVGVITFSSENRADDHFKGVTLNVVPPVKGMPVGGAFHNWIT